MSIFQHLWETVARLARAQLIWDLNENDMVEVAM